MTSFTFPSSINDETDKKVVVTLIKLPCGTIHLETEEGGHTCLEKVNQINIITGDDQTILSLDFAGDSGADWIDLDPKHLETIKQNFSVSISKAPTKKTTETIAIVLENEDSDRALGWFGIKNGVLCYQDFTQPNS